MIISMVVGVVVLLTAITTTLLHFSVLALRDSAFAGRVANSQPTRADCEPRMRLSLRLMVIGRPGTPLVS